VPLGETVAARGSFLVVDRGRLLSDGTDDDVEQAGRLRVLWQPKTIISLILERDLGTKRKGPGLCNAASRTGTDEWTSASATRRISS